MLKGCLGFCCLVVQRMALNNKQLNNKQYPVFNYLRFKLYNMNLHEYQAKELLKKYNVSIQEGIPCTTPGAAEEAYKQIHTQSGSNYAVVKAQIHAGGRGKGKIAGTEQRGEAVGKTAEDVKQIAQNILGGTLVTIQTGPGGKLVKKVLVAQDVYYEGP